MIEMGETLAEKRRRIKVQRGQAVPIMQRAQALEYASGISVRDGRVVLRCAKAYRQGLVLTWDALGLSGVSIYGDQAGPAILGRRATDVLVDGIGGQ